MLLSIRIMTFSTGFARISSTLRTNPFCQTILPLVICMACYCGSAIGQDSKFKYLPDDYQPPAYAVMTIHSGLPEGIQSDSLIEELELDDTEQPEFGWFIYGDSNSRSVATMTLKGESLRLFVDLNRDKHFSKSEEIAQSGTQRWKTTLKSEYVLSQSRYRHQNLSVVFDRNPRTGSLSVGTLGAMVGQANYDGQLRLAKYVDRNSNGRWFDEQDRIFLDVDANNVIDLLSERFTCQTMCRIGRKQFALGGDKTGETLFLEEVTETGKIQPLIATLADDVEILNFEASLASESGVHIQMKDLETPIECPVGEYHVEQVRIQVRGIEGVYSFRFATLGKSGSGIEVEEDETATIDLIGNLKLTSNDSILSEDTSTTISISPMVSTDSGLYLIVSRRGKTERSTNENRLIARSNYRGKEISLQSSGFS